MSRPIEDGARRMAQLTDYRRRRASGHQDGRSDRDRREIAQTQPDIEVLDGQQRGLQKRVATEAPMIAGASDLAAGGMWAPVRDTWRRAGARLGGRAGDARRFAIIALSWIPIAGGDPGGAAVGLAAT